ACDSARHGASAEAAQTGRQKQAPETASLSAFASRNGWRRISEFCWGQEMGVSEPDSLGRILSDLARRHETVFPNCGRPPGQRELGGAERSAEKGRYSQRGL